MTARDMSNRLREGSEWECTMREVTGLSSLS
jgi:hypothetical protein